MACRQPRAQVPALLPKRLSLRSRPVDLDGWNGVGYDRALHCVETGDNRAAAVAKRNILGAFDKFYAEDVLMQENLEEPTAS